MAVILGRKAGSSGGGGAPSGPAGGSLAGTYPDPTIGANGVDTAAIQNGAVTAAKVAADVATQAELDAIKVKVYFNKPAGNITRASTSIGAFSTAWQITGVVVAAGQNIRLSANISTLGGTGDYLFAIFRDATHIASSIHGVAAPGLIGNHDLLWVDANPGAATYTYEIQAAQFTSGTLTVYQTVITTDTAGGSSIFVADVYTP